MTPEPPVVPSASADAQRVEAVRELGESVGGFYHAIRRFIVDKEQTHGASAVRRGIMGMVRTPMRAKTLASMLGLSESGLSRHVTNLEAEGLIARTADPTDGRAQLITLTEQGRREHAEYAEHHIHVFLELLEEWDTEKMGAAAALLADLQSALIDQRALRTHTALGQPGGTPDSLQNHTTPRTENP